MFKIFILQTLTSGKYAYAEVLHMRADIFNTTFWKAKICEEIKFKRIKGCIADKALADI